MPTLEILRASAAAKNLTRVDNIVATRSTIHAKGIFAIRLFPFTAYKLVWKRTLIVIVIGWVAKGGTAIAFPLERHAIGIGFRKALAPIKAGANATVIVVGRAHVYGEGAVATRKSMITFAIILEKGRWLVVQGSEK